MVINKQLGEIKIRTVNKYKEVISEWFYLGKDDMTVYRAKDGYHGRYKQHDIVTPYQLCSYGYGGVHVPTTRTTIPYHTLLTTLRGITIPDNAVIDHINGDHNDNSRVNIRVVTQQINCRNARMHDNNTSGVTGINWNAASNSYVVRKYTQGNRVYLGHRKTLQEAELLLDQYQTTLLADGYTTRHGKESSTTRPQGRTLKRVEAPNP